MEQEPLASVGGRKFVFALVTAVMACTLTALSVMPVEMFVEFIKYLFGFYVVGNIASKITAKFPTV